MRSVAVACALLLACSSSRNDASSAINPIDPAADAGADAAAPLYPDIATLHDQAISRTCALNNGVCHSSKQYPDLHTVSDFIASTVNRGCNAQVDDRTDFRDACEVEGDHVVVSSLGIDQEIVTVDGAPSTAAPRAFASITLNVKSAIATATITPGTAVEIHRGATVFPLRGATLTKASGTTVVLSLAGADAGVQTLLDDRVYPWNELMVRVGDVNRNGVLGESLGIHLVTPGDPNKSFVMMRLLDPNQGELMPAVCRQWSDDATKALGCWIKGLRADATNAFDPIDYASCDYVPAPTGRCSKSDAVGYAGVVSIFSQHCAASGCHGGAGPAAGLDLSSADAARTALVSVPSTQVPGSMRVAPGDPDASYLLCKVDPACTTRVGARMPKDGAPLVDADLAQIRTWIASGAATQ